MYIKAIKTFFFLTLIIAFLVMAFITNDAGNRKLFSSLGIISLAFVSKFMSTQNTTTDEKY